jgi:deoxyribodipyrimidine photo-lyase
MKLSVFWFRRDLRLEDNTALNLALSSGLPVLTLFIFDENILGELSTDDARVNFIYERLLSINKELKKHGSSVKIFIGEPVSVWGKIITQFDMANVYLNKDYEPYAIERDAQVRALLGQHGIRLFECKDQMIFEESEVVKEDGKPYTVYTPYRKKWLQQFHKSSGGSSELSRSGHFFPCNHSFPTLAKIGFQKSPIKILDYDMARLDRYAATRDLPGEDSTTYLGPHLRFGTISIRQVIQQLKPEDDVFLGELIWREFFMQILSHYPKVVDQNFNARYNGIAWRNDEKEFDRWCRGETGYPLVDAGMRQLNRTGYLHNRVRMVAASFLCKHLLIDWRWGEGYFAQKLMDYELSSNNGNWQWAAGTGCDAAPYFRVFNPMIQLQKFDRDFAYVKKWLPEFGTPDYPAPIVEHQFARNRALEVYKKALTIRGV